MLKIRAKKESIRRTKEMGDGAKMVTGMTRKAAEAETTPEAAQLLGDIDT